MKRNDFVLRMRGLFLRSQVERDLDEELKFHLEMEARKNAAAGLDAAGARRQARIAFGGAEAIKEECRDVRGTRWLEDFAHDLRYGFRMLRKDRGYTLAAIVALAVGIGANTSLFTIFAAVVLKPLPVSDPAAVVSMWRAPRTCSAEDSSPSATICTTATTIPFSPALPWRHPGISAWRLRPRASPSP